VEDLSEKASAVLRVKLPSEEMSETIQKALEPETKTSITYRSKVRLDREGKTVALFFEAEDTTALRASINSYLGWLQLLWDLCNSLQLVAFSGP
jgi:KEOPS complex subunit Pcc1